MLPTPATGSSNEPSQAPTEPVRYEFQSYLSGDDDEAAILRAAFDPLVAETYHDPDTPMLDPGQSLHTAAPQEQEDPVDITSPADAPPARSAHSPDGDGYNAMEVDSGAVDFMSPSRQEIPAANGDDADSSSDVVTRARTRTRRVKIEVALPQIPRKKRMSYELMELESDEELSAVSAPRSPRRLRKRTTVSNSSSDESFSPPILLASTLYPIQMASS